MRKWIAFGMLAAGCAGAPGSLKYQLAEKRAEVKRLHVECLAASEKCKAAELADIELAELRREWDARRQRQGAVITRRGAAGREVMCGVDPASGRPYCF